MPLLALGSGAILLASAVAAMRRLLDRVGAPP